MQRDMDLIRKVLFEIEDTIWKKTKETISEKGLPFVFDIVKSVSTEIIAGVVKGFVGL